MAYVKLLRLKSEGHVSNAVRYIENPEKTDGNRLVSSYACNQETAGLDFELTKLIALKAGRRMNKHQDPVQAYHVIQSFAHGEVSPEKAHEIGKQLADRMLDGRFEFVVVTHNDKEHIHNHIIFNSVSFLDSKKFVNEIRGENTVQKLRRFSDELCIQNDLSVINNPSKAGYSYKEWMERNQRTSWKSEIRQRLNFVLSRANNVAEFQRYCTALGIQVNTSGKYVKYHMTGMERNIRDDTLSQAANERPFSYDAIQQRCKDNYLNKKTLASALAESIPQCSTLNELIIRLRQQEILLEESYRGLRWTINGRKYTEQELGACFSAEQLTDALKEKRYQIEEKNRDISAEWNNTVKPQKRKEEPMELDATLVKKVNKDGILIELDGKEMFLSNRQLDYHEESKRYTVYINPRYDYHFAPQKQNPDVRMDEQESEDAVSGEDFLRRLDILNGAKPHVIQIDSSMIRTFSEKGMTITLPSDGIDKLFIPAEYIRNNSLGQVEVMLYANWNYRFKTASGYESIKGEELKSAVLPDHSPPSQRLLRSIRAMERRNSMSNIARMNDALWTIQREGVDNQHSIADAKAQIQTEIVSVKGQIETTRKSISSFQMAYKQLLMVREYGDVYNTWNAITGFRKGRYEKAHATELAAYRNAMEFLTSNRIKPQLDPDKVQALIDQRKEKEVGLNAELSRLTERVRKLDEAQRELQRIQRQEPGQSEKKKKSDWSL